MKKWKLGVAMLVILLAGGCIGAALTGLYVRHLIVDVVDGGPPAVSRFVTNRLAKRLDLTPAQKEAVQLIVNQAQNDLQQVRMRYRPETMRVIGNAMVQIKRELTPVQQQKLEMLAQRLRGRWMKDQSDPENTAIPGQ